MTHLGFDMIGAFGEGEKRHAQTVMKDLGITYMYAVPQSIGDMWQFWRCENIPADLPAYIYPLKADPMQCIGYGLTREMAERIAHNGEPSR